MHLCKGYEVISRGAFFRTDKVTRLQLHDAARSPAYAEDLPALHAESRNRTDDTRFFRPVLYRLSYLGAIPER
jgi:hypothetical protein